MLQPSLQRCVSRSRAELRPEGPKIEAASRYYGDYMTVRFKPLKCTIDVSVHGAFGAWSWAALTSRFIARGVRHSDEHLYCNAE